MQRARGRAAFLLHYGLVLIGTPAAVLLDLALLVRRGDLPILLSAEHAVQLSLLLFTVAPTVGPLVGRLLWRVGERRLATERLKHAFYVTTGSDAAVRNEPPQTI